MKTVLAAIALMTTAATASADIACQPATDMEAALKDWYGERPVDVRVGNTQLWASDRHETWTLVRYLPDGVACTVASGTGDPSERPGPDRVAELAAPDAE
ncbi:S-adenosyl-L-homocysteine hydrolase [Aliishimia ponticola]|uniref:S-adenosyl-L-homocysteine hydrolase n=1 Tax=Aliishimia ponticola TaxID=2499833 RepID=UPI001B3BDEAC|nr:S-adenosyl-L-homocysteine hydrolase [Aliishimia ponticola]